MRPLQISEEKGVLVIKLDDASALNDGHTVGHPTDALFQALLAGGDDPGRVVLDLSGRSNSSPARAVALLIGTEKASRRSWQGRLVLFGVEPETSWSNSRTMKLVGLCSRFAADLPHRRSNCRPIRTSSDLILFSPFARHPSLLQTCQHAHEVPSASGGPKRRRVISPGASTRG